MRILFILYYSKSKRHKTRRYY